MTKLLLSVALSIILLAFGSCLEEEEPEIDPCGVDGDWGKVERNGEEICFPAASAFYYNANTSYATFEVQLYTPAVASAVSLSAKFNVPVVGLELNKPYALTAGDFYGAEDLVSGEMTILTYEPVSSGDYCASGTFSMITENPNSGSQTNLTNGKFVFYNGITDCNPF